MRLKTLVALASTGALVGMGAVALPETAAFGAAAVHAPVTDLPIIYPSPNPTGALPSPGSPFLTVVGTCPDFLFGPDGTLGQYAIGFAFVSGTDTFYRIPAGSSPGAANGGNIEGIADLVYADPGIPDMSDPADSVPPSNPQNSSYVGQAHVWFGSNSNANGQSYFGETISFHGTTPDGSTITITANPGANTSASGNMNNWGKLKVTCS